MISCSFSGRYHLIYANKVLGTISLLHFGQSWKDVSTWESLWVQGILQRRWSGTRRIDSSHDETKAERWWFWYFFWIWERRGKVSEIIFGRQLLAELVGTCMLAQVGCATLCAKTYLEILDGTWQVAAILVFDSHACCSSECICLWSKSKSCCNGNWWIRPRIKTKNKLKNRLECECTQRSLGISILVLIVFG